MSTSQGSALNDRALAIDWVTLNIATLSDKPIRPDAVSR